MICRQISACLIRYLDANSLDTVSRSQLLHNIGICTTTSNNFFAPSAFSRRFDLSKNVAGSKFHNNRSPFLSRKNSPENHQERINIFHRNFPGKKLFCRSQKKKRFTQNSFVLKSFVVIAGAFTMRSAWLSTKKEKSPDFSICSCTSHPPQVFDFRKSFSSPDRGKGAKIQRRRIWRLFFTIDCQSERDKIKNRRDLPAV